MAFSVWLYFSVLLTLCNKITGDIDCLNSCDISRNFIILFDEFQSMENLWATQEFVSKLGRLLRTHSEENRVAIGTFQGIKSSLEDSLYRRSTAFEQAILDLDITPSSYSHLGTAIDLVEPLVSGVQRVTSVLFIIASKGRDDEENKRTESKAIALFKAARNVSGYAIGIGEYIHEGTFASLCGYPKSKRGWMIDAVSNLDDIEGRVVTKLLCDHKISMPITALGIVTLYTEVNLTGNGVEVSLEDHSCKDIQGLLAGKNLTSMQNHKQCIALYDQPGCKNGLLTVFEDQAGVYNLTKKRGALPNDWPYRYIRPCETAQPTKDKQDYVTWYIWHDYIDNTPNKSYRPTNGSCLTVGTNNPIKSIKMHGNCIILFDNDNCAPSRKAQRIAQDNTELWDLPIYGAKSFKFCN